MNIIVKVPRSTPTRALLLILNIFPLHLHLIKEGMATSLRIMGQFTMNWAGVYPNLTYSVSHLRFWEYMTQDFGLCGNQVEYDECCVPIPT